MLPGSRLVKRLADYVVILGTLPVTLPVLLVIGTLVRLSSKGPVFYQQQRLGTGGAVFFACKFRTMRSDADQVLQQYLRETSQEMKRVSWPGLAELKESTIVVIVTVAVVTFLIFVVDKVLSFTIKRLITMA